MPGPAGRPDLQLAAPLPSWGPARLCDPPTPSFLGLAARPQAWGSPRKGPSKCLFKKQGVKRKAAPSPGLQQACLGHRSLGFLVSDPAAGTKGRVIGREPSEFLRTLC